MARQVPPLQLYRGTTAQNNAYTGAVGELSYDTQTKQIRIHDGVTRGGFPLAVSAGVVHLAGAETIADQKTFTVSPIVPTPVTGDSSTKAATTAFVQTALENTAVILGTTQTITGQKGFAVSPTAPTPTTGDNTTKLATTAFVQTAVSQNQYSLPTASASTLGGVKIGTGLSISNGVLSTALSAAVNSTSATTAATSSAVKTAYDLANSAYNEATNKSIKVNPTTTIPNYSVAYMNSTTPVSIYHYNTFSDIHKGDLPPAAKAAYINLGDTSNRNILQTIAARIALLLGSTGNTSILNYVYPWEYTDEDTDTANTAAYGTELRYMLGKNTQAGDPIVIFMPSHSNMVNLGYSDSYWKDAYIGSASPIAHSDARLKTAITAIPDAVLDAWGDVQWQQYQMIDAVEKKGASAARIHTGAIAQRIDTVFKAHGLDASRYGLFCHDTWDAEDWDETIVDKEAVTDEQGNVVEPEVSHTEHHHRDAGDMYALRYGECLCLEAAYQRRRADRMEVRLAAVEAKLGA